MIVVVVRVGVVVLIGAVQPQARPEGEEACGGENGKNARWGGGAGPVRRCGTAAVVSSAAVRGGRAATGCGPATSVRAGRTPTSATEMDG